MVSIETQDIRRKIGELAKSLPPRILRKILTQASKPYTVAAKRNAPVSDKPHSRYSTPKVSNKLKAPKGMGKVVATYTPGNLKRSIKKITASRMPYAILIGPKVQKRNSKGLFKGNRVDAYYAHMIEGGTKDITAKPFLAPAWDATKGQVINNVYRDLSAFMRSKAQAL